jgi:hypothetical protein
MIKHWVETKYFNLKLMSSGGNGMVSGTWY